MVSHDTQIRVRYGEVDRMGYMYYGNYPLYYEVGRTELMRTLGYNYRELEDSGILLPVVSINIKYIAPALYDDLLTIRVSIRDIPTARITFYYEIYNPQEKLINEGETTLVFVHADTRRPMRAPADFTELLEKKGLK